MKKIVISLFTAAALLIANTAINQLHAENIDLQKAKQVAAYYYGVQSGKSSVKSNDMKLVYQIDNTVLDVPALYFFNAPETGFVIVAGSDCTDPIIGYSTENSLDPANMPANMLYFLNSYVQGIVYAQNTQAQPSAQIQQTWDELLYERLDRNQPKQIYKTLTSTWDQSYPYNTMCPTINGEHCVTGCVATAFAQIIHYWRYPIKPAGAVTYSAGEAGNISENFTHYQFNYDLMPDAYDMNWTQEEVNEVSLLNYLCGVSSRMGYGIDGSGSMSSRYAKQAFKTNFKYNGTMLKELDRTKNPFNVAGTTPTYGDTLWVDTCVKEIKAKRPIFYTGHDNSSTGTHAGHAWVCDGYNSSNKKVHMNWGWSGFGDGYFNLYTSHLNAQGYLFSDSHWALIGIEPPQDSLPSVGINSAAVDPFCAPAYPNPATTSFTIPYQVNSPAMIEIFNVEGRRMEARKIEGEGAIVVDVKDWAKGIYVYRLNGVTRKFIVQ